ncbi:hypothetical protein HO173_008149 [Letharia columbiana]|uniref:Uncharacterized protein n=1 Tax=Letharia columbiana TaxID=112416 RepID=A0A8H6FS07_9LECA|nr:uncharacterized protein HO173_008149 [Letharia columbiana]KAF6233592.1 hypothetical protein HO173_008149 [Letharia columbiana]
MTPPPLGEGHGGRRPRRESRALLEGIIKHNSRDANFTNSVSSGIPLPAPDLSNLAARNGPFSHIRIIPKPPVEETPEQRMQRTNPFTFKKPSFSEEAEANVSSHPNPYNWQVNLANASDGASFAQKARAAELNAARARRAAQMQSIDDEIPDLSGAVSLGTYKFTRRGRGKKYETHKLSELQEIQEKEGENKVTEPASTSSVHPLFSPPSPTTLSSSQLPERPHHIEAELDDRILNHLDNPSPDRRGSHEPDLPHCDELGPSHYATKLPSPIRSSYADRRSSQASGQANSSFPPAQDHRSSQDFSALIQQDTLSSQPSGQVHSSFPPKYYGSTQHFSATINPHSQSSLPASRQAHNSFQLQGHSLNHNSYTPVNTDRRSSQVSGQTQPSFPLPARHLDASQQYGQFAKSLTALINTDRRGSKNSGQAAFPFTPQDFQQRILDPYREIESKANGSLAAHRQSSQASSQVHRPASPKAYSAPRSLPLSDTLPTATFNLETNQWDPDLPEANMATQTPTNKSTRGGHSGQQSSRQSSSRNSHASQDVHNPHAIVTTTKSGRPYTNPYMPTDPPPSTARQITRESPSGNINLDTQYDDPDMVQRQRKMRYMDQEEARYRALELAKQEQSEEYLDDPFQDQPTHIQHYGRNQPSKYAEYAAQQAVYGQSPDYGHQPTLTTYASDPSASSFLSNAQQVTHAPNAGMSPYRGQQSAYEQQAFVNNRDQNPGAGPHELRAAFEQQLVSKPRASVRLPAVRGTIDQQKEFLQEPKLESLSLEDYTGKIAQDQRRRPTQGGVQPPSGRLSHAVPIRDPAAYTGSGLTMRRNQEALRQNLDTVVASSQGPTGSARTVMNDPHRDRQPSSRPSSTVTDTTVTGSTLRAQAPSYESITTQRPVTTNPAFMKPRPDTSRRQGRAALGESDHLPLQYYAGDMLKSPERATAATEITGLREPYRAPAAPPGFGHDAAAYTKNAGLPAAAIGAGNAFMNEIAKGAPPKRNPQQRLEEAATWFRTDPRDLSYAAAILPRQTMNRMNPERFPLEDAAPRTVSQLADNSEDDDPSDRARQAATPRPIGHGRPPGFTTPPSNHGPTRAATQAPFSTLAGVTSVNDTEGMVRSAREFLDDDARAIEAMFGGVYSNLMAGMNGPYDYMNHYAPPPAYAIDHNAKNDHTFFDPQWFATAPPARVGRDPRREQGEYEDPTQGSASRRGDHARGEVSGRDSGGRGGSGGRAWGRN